ncbi:hypothetical protein ACFZCL_33080 [Streptomyces sp. NPDC008159]|uniref:hypothetical protein n=1 Tax=Streptomyces sp. NPDC008159 TaxID=3364817 RepID=UPI0036F0F150
MGGFACRLSAAEHSSTLNALDLTENDYCKGRPIHSTAARRTRPRPGELPRQTLLARLDQRRATWPKTPNRHVLINAKTALGTGPVSPEHLKRHLLHQGVYLERIRGDRVLHEALTVGADPLHLALVFNLSHTTASSYAAIAQNLLDDTAAVEELPLSQWRPRRRTS